LSHEGSADFRRMTYSNSDNREPRPNKERPPRRGLESPIGARAVERPDQSKVPGEQRFRQS